MRKWILERIGNVSRAPTLKNIAICCSFDAMTSLCELLETRRILSKLGDGPDAMIDRCPPPHVRKLLLMLDWCAFIRSWNAATEQRSVPITQTCQRCASWSHCLSFAPRSVPQQIKTFLIQTTTNSPREIPPPGLEPGSLG